MSAPSLALSIAPSVGHATAPKRGAAPAEADFAGIMDDAAAAEAPVKAKIPEITKTEAGTAPVEDAPVDVPADVDAVADASAVVPAPVTPTPPPVTIAMTPVTSATPAPSLQPTPVLATESDPSPSDAAVGDDTASTSTPASPSGEALDLAALQAELVKAQAPRPAVAPPPAAVAPLVPRDVKPAADTVATTEILDETVEPSAATTLDVPTIPSALAEAPRTRDVIDRAQTMRADAGSSGAPATEPDPANQPDAPQAPLTATVAMRPATIVEPMAAQILADPEAPVASAPAATPTNEARPSETAASLALSTLSHASIETTAHLAAQIVRKLEGRSTRFEMALTPEGLGNVDVSLDIDADGKLIARMAFDNPLAATEMRGRVDDLRRQLQDAGFTVADDALSFTERDASAGQQGGAAFDQRPDPRNARAFGAGARLSAEADMAMAGRWIPLTLAPDRVDMKV